MLAHHARQDARAELPYTLDAIATARWSEAAIGACRDRERTIAGTGDDDEVMFGDGVELGSTTE